MSSPKFLYLRDDSIKKIICAYFELSIKLSDFDSELPKRVVNLLLLIYFYNQTKTGIKINQSLAMKYYGSSYQNFYQILSDLVVKGIISKEIQKYDKRQKTLSLTEKGIQLIQPFVDDVMIRVYNIAKEKDENTITGFINFILQSKTGAK